VYTSSCNRHITTQATQLGVVTVYPSSSERHITTQATQLGVVTVYPSSCNTTNTSEHYLNLSSRDTVI